MSNEIHETAEVTTIAQNDGWRRFERVVEIDDPEDMAMLDVPDGMQSMARKLYANLLKADEQVKAECFGINAAMIVCAVKCKGDTWGQAEFSFSPMQCNVKAISHMGDVFEFRAIDPRAWRGTEAAE